MNDPRGSIWRKWDLHLHTPASVEDYQDKSITNEAIIKKLKESNIAAVAITDHHSIDVDRIMALQSIAGTDIAIFPGIECRSELGGRESVHFTGIFSDGLNETQLKAIWTKLSGPLAITEQDREDKGKDKLYCDLKDSANLIHDLGGLVIVHAGTKNNTIENIKSNLGKFKDQVKTDLVSDFIDILEISKPENQHDYNTIVFPAIGFRLPMICCSDNHKISEYENNRFTWIKADQTFEGLKQILIEPEGRVFIGDEPGIFNRVRKSKTRNISTISFEKIHGSPPDEKWFEGCTDIPINSELVAIIGNKGSGKSALADTIGLLGNSKQQEHFSFLRKEKFCDPMKNKAEYFAASLKWEDDFTKVRGLAERIDHTEKEMVSYIPQNYLETICSDKVEDDEFKKELKAVIFSHVDETERLGCSSLDDLIATKTTEKREAIEIIKKSINRVNSEIIKFERMIHPDYKKELGNKLVLKEAERKAIEEPLEVKKPDADDPIRQAKIEVITKNLATKQLERIGICI